MWSCYIPQKGKKKKSCIRHSRILYEESETQKKE